MAFTDVQKINMFTKALIAGVIDSESMAAWYESFFPFTFIMDSVQVWLELPLLKQYPARNLSIARTNVASNLQDQVSDLSQPADAVRLTLMTGSNGTTWVAYTTYNDSSSAILNNWLLPQLIPQVSGSPSNGYGILLYNGDPNDGGTLISTTTGATGSGENASQAWIFNYAKGLLFLSPDFTGTVDDPYILGFRYIGKTVQDLAGLADISEDIGDINTAIQELQDEMDQAQTDISANETAIAQNASDIASQATTLATHTSQIAEHDTEIDGLQTQIDDINETLNTTGLIASFGEDE